MQTGEHTELLLPPRLQILMIKDYDDHDFIHYRLDEIAALNDHH